MNSGLAFMAFFISVSVAAEEEQENAAADSGLYPLNIPNTYCYGERSPVR
jgi:hypothetical protein